MTDGGLQYALAVTFSWQDAEDLATEHMRALGHLDARKTNAGADAGLDVVSEDGRVAVQVKHYSGAVGRPDIQRLVGAGSRYTEHLFYARSGYSRAAHEFADDHDVALFRYDASGMVSPVNARATELDARLEGDYKLRRIRQREREMARDAHLKVNPPLPAWQVEWRSEYFPVLLRLRAMYDVWMPLEQALQSSGRAGAGELLAWLQGERTRISGLLDAQDAAEAEIPRHWEAELQRMQAMRQGVAGLERQWALYLAGVTDVTSLLNAAVTVALEDDAAARNIVGSEFVPQLVKPLPTDQDWRNVLLRRAAVMVRYEGVIAALAEVDRRSPYNQSWLRSRHLFYELLSDVPALLNLREGWWGPEDFGIRFEDTVQAGIRVAGAEQALVENWGAQLKVGRLIQSYANSWLVRNNDRTDIAALWSAGHTTSLPLGDWPA